MGSNLVRSSPLNERNQVSRRGFLKSTVALGGVGVAGALLTACTSDDDGAPEGDSGASPEGTAPVRDVTLLVSQAGPYAGMPSVEDQESSVTARAYAESLQEWLDLNPGVAISEAAIDIWDQDAMVTAVAGGTAPAIYVANVLGNWWQPTINSAFLQGMAADVTDIIEQTGFLDQLADSVRPGWEDQWRVDGRFYGGPGSFSVGDGVFYRRDLFAEAGIGDPPPNWTWTDVTEYAREFTGNGRQGIAEPNWAMAIRLSSAGAEAVYQVPAPDSPWRWRADWTTYADLWIATVEEWRRSMFEDQAILSDITYNDWPPVAEAFLRGDVVMRPGNSASFVDSPDDENSFAAFAESMDMEIGDVVGWQSHPLGQLGQYTTRKTFITASSFSPDLSEDELEAAFSLYSYMVGPGLVRQAEVVHAETGDLRRVYSAQRLTPVTAGTFDALPGDPAEVWGEQYVAAAQEAGQRLALPERSSFFPTEESSGPSQAVQDDAYSKWMYEPGNIDIRADMENLEEVWNTQAESFNSVMPREEFIEAAKRFYEAHDAFLQQDAPAFHEQIFRPFYENHVLPALDA